MPEWKMVTFIPEWKKGDVSHEDPCLDSNKESGM